MKKMLLLILILAITSVTFSACSSSGAYDSEHLERIDILFVGNSHVRTGNVPGQLQAIARLHGIEITYVDVSINGSGLDGALRENAIREMQKKSFDYVVMQQPAGRGGRITNDVDAFFNNIRTFSEIVKENGATPVLYSPMWMSIDGQPNEDFHRISSEMFRRAAYENDAILVDVGGVWVYAFKTLPGISLYARDGIHANYAGAFLAACVFMATLFGLQIENIPTGNMIDSMPMLNILTFAGFASVSLVIIYRFSKKQPLYLKNPLLVIGAILLVQTMSFFPHVFLFTEWGNRIMLLYVILLGLLSVTLCSIYRIVRIKFIEKQPLVSARKDIFYVLTCSIIYSLTFIPSLELRLPLYRGNNATALAQTVLNFIDYLFLC